MQPTCSYALSVTMLQYQTCVMRRDFAAADQLMSAIPQDQRTRVARFLEKQGMRKRAASLRHLTGVLNHTAHVHRLPGTGAARVVGSGPQV